MKPMLGAIIILMLASVSWAGEDVKGEGPEDKELLARQTELADRIVEAISGNASDKLEKCVTTRTLFWKSYSPGEGGFGSKGPEKLTQVKWLTAATEAFQKVEIEKFFRETDRGYVCEINWKGKRPDFLCTLSITMHEFGKDGWLATSVCVSERGTRKK